MHSNWEELIPFYIAGTLPKPDTSRLENHLASCDECRSFVEEWRAIATVVRNEAAGQMRDLPSLSAQVLSVANQQSFRRHQSAGISLASARPTTRYRATSITLIAAVFTVIVFGGLLTFMVLRGTQPRQGDVVLLPTATPSATVTQEVTEGKLSLSPSPFLSPEPPQTTSIAPSVQPQIIVIEPSLAPSPSLVFATQIVPTRSVPTAIAPNIIQPTQIIPTAVLLPTDTPQTFAQSMMLGAGGAACTIQAAIPNSVVNLYAGPGTNYTVVKTFSNDDQLIALGKSDNGWYRAQYEPDNNQWIGWVRQELVFTTGSCDNLPVFAAADYQTDATPSAIPPIVDPPLVNISSDGINLRSGPGTNYPIVGSAHLGESYHVEAQSGSGAQLWYLVSVPGTRSAWVFGTLVQLSPANAIIEPAMTIPPSPLPTMTPSPTPSATSLPNIVSGHWSQTMTVLSTTCAGGTVGTSTTTPVTLAVSGDMITLAYADAGTPFTLNRSGDRAYVGGYATPNTNVSVTVTFTSSTGYAGTAIVTQSDGCTTQAAWNGLFQSS